MACEPEDVMAGAQSLCCIPPNLHAAVQSYLLARIRGGSMDVNEIVREAACEISCIPPGLLPRIRTYLLCQLSNTGGGVIPTPECDADALAYLTAAGISDQTQRDAVCRLVAGLKNHGTPAFWDSEVLIYPFVGGTAASHAVNLKSPGTYNLAYAGAAMTHSNLGMKGNGGYATTSFIPRTGPPAMPLNNSRFYVYLDSLSAVVGSCNAGCRTNASTERLVQSYLGPTIAHSLFEGGSVAIAGGNGGFIDTLSGAARSIAYNGGAYTTPAYVQTNSPSCQLLLLALNNNAAGLGVNPVSQSLSRISGFSLGIRGLTAAEWPVYHSIWQTFENELGRMRP